MASAKTGPAHSMGYTLGVMALGVALLGLALAYGIDALGRSARPVVTAGTGEMTLTRSLGGREFHIPASWFRSDPESGPGFAKQIDLELALPLGAGGKAAKVGVTLLPRSQVRPSSSLLDGVYLHQFMPEQLNGPPGLIGKPLVAADGYANETVWYDALSSSPFVAKCIAPVSGETEGRCLRMVYLGTGVAAIYDFGSDVLANWRKFDPETRARMASIGAL